MLYALIVCVEKKPEEFPFYVRMLVFILINPFKFFLANSSIQLAGVQFILDSVVNELAKDPNKRSVQKINIFCCDKNIIASIPFPLNY